MEETQVQSRGPEDPLEATHSRILAWRIPMDRGARWATVPWDPRESDKAEQLTLGPVLETGSEKLAPELWKPLLSEVRKNRGFVLFTVAWNSLAVQESTPCPEGKGCEFDPQSGN